MIWARPDKISAQSRGPSGPARGLKRHHEAPIGVVQPANYNYQSIAPQLPIANYRNQL
jgi:hypothetical protein